MNGRTSWYSLAPVRVLFWSDLYWPYIGGAEIFGMRLLAALRERGVEFLVITSHHDRELPDDDEHDGIPIRRLPFRTAIAGRDVRALVGAIGRTAAIKRAFAPDLIHMNAIGPSALFHLRTNDATPLLATVQQEVLATQTGGESTLLAQIVTSAQWVTGVSETVLEQLRAAHPSIAPRSSCIYNGIDPPALIPAPLPETPHVLCLGRLVPAKGFDVALRAFAQLAERFANVKFTIAGDGASRDDLVALAASLGITDRVAFLGWVDPANVPSLLNEASVVVMPSRREGLPIAGVQAALMARPIVATAAGGLREVVVDGENGIVVAADDVDAVAAAIARLISDCDGASAMGDRGRQRALRVFDWQRTVVSYHQLYTSLSERS